MRALPVVLAAAALSAAGPAASLQRESVELDRPPDCIDYGAHMRPVFDQQTTSLTDVAAAGDVVFLALPGDLEAWDASDPEDLRRIGAVDVPGAASAVAVRGDRAYVARGGSQQGLKGLVVVDVSDPAAMQVLGELPTSSRAHSVAVSGGLACLATDAGATLVDVSTDTPVILAEIPVAVRAHGASFAGGTLVLASGALGARVYDVSQPAAPILLGTWWPGSGAEVVSVGGGEGATEVVVGTEANPAFSRFEWEVVRLDVSDPENVVDTARASVHGLPRRLAVSEGRLFVCYTAHTPFNDTRSGLQVFRLGAAGGAVDELGAVGRRAARGAVAVLGNHAVLADSTVSSVGHLRVVDVGAPAPALLGSWTGQYSGPVFVRGDLLFTLGSGRPLEIRDATSPGMPLVGSVPGIQAPGVFAWSDGLLFVAWGGSAGRLDIIALDGPAGARIVGGLPLTDPPSDLAVRGGMAYVAEFREVYESQAVGTFRVIDVRRPEAPVEIWSSGVPSRRVALAGPRAHVVTDHSFAPVILPSIQTYDVSEPVPVLVDELPTAGWAGPLVAGREALFFARGSAVEVFSLEDPLHPVPAGSVALPSIEDTAGLLGLALRDGMLYVANDVGGLQVVDVTDPGRPAVLGSYHAGAAVDGVQVSETGVFAAVSGAVLRLPLQCGAAKRPITPASRPAPPRSGRELLVSPSPFSDGTTVSFRLSRPGHASVAVYDVCGRRVRELLDARLGPGDHAVSWNAGGATPAGVYFVRLETAEGSRSARVLRIR
jgi:hypothetical protein